MESAGDISNLSSNLLDISKIEDGNIAEEKRDLFFEEIAAIAQKCGRNMMFDERKIAVRITPPRTEFKIWANAYYVERILQNLYANAAKYTVNDGAVDLSFQTTPDEDIVVLFSSGPPIAEVHREMIFEKYARIDKNASQYSKGLGLFFCRMVMNAQKGRIWLDTDERGNYFKLAFRKKK